MPITYNTYFESTITTIAINSGYTLSHNIGSVKDYSITGITLICKTANSGYSVGDELCYFDGNSGSGTNAYGIIPTKNADGVTMTVSTYGGGVNIGIAPKGGGALVNSAAANWSIRFKVRRDY